MSRQAFLAAAVSAVAAIASDPNLTKDLKTVDDPTYRDTDDIQEPILVQATKSHLFVGKQVRANGYLGTVLAVKMSAWKTPCLQIQMESGYTFWCPEKDCVLV